ncbi:MAG TPA: AMP-binding protein [Acidimicrobiia bacterium]|nr:AMP-binding protein [Acidimicrobiia bacterium]
MADAVEIVEATTFGDLLLKTALERPDDEALVFPEIRFTYAELFEHAVDTARGLAALGVGRGDHVGILMPNCPEFVHAFFGVALLGGVVVPINARFKRRELAYVVENADLKVLVTSDIIADHVDFVGLLRDSLPSLAAASDSAALSLPEAPLLRSVVLMGDRTPDGMLGQKEFYARALDVDRGTVMRAREQVRIRDIAAIPYTSGTTSYPKGCLLTHEAIVRDWILSGRRFGVETGDRFWNPCPLFHMSGIGPLLFTLAVGGTLITMTHFDPASALRQIEEERPTVIYPTFPPITMALITHPDYDPAKFSQVKATLNVAPPDTLRMMQDKLPQAIQISCYGITEGSGVITYNELTETVDQRCETTGPPLPGAEVRIVDPATGDECAPGEPGEICIRGFNVFEGYYKDPEKTAETFDSEGWAHTGDLGSVDEAGRVIYVGRLKDMLKVGGENVAPSEIEAHLSTHPAVKLVQVVGKPDDKYVEVPVAFVELADGATATDEELIGWCQGQLASFKVPREVVFVTEWPMSATKIQKYKLRELLVSS